MHVSRLVLDPVVVECVEAARVLRKTRVVSDIVDAAGNQYVDLVMEGSGVLAGALLGYTYVLEQAGVRFLSIAGSSSGAICALLLAAAGTKDQQRSERAAAELVTIGVRAMLDGDPSAQRVCDVALGPRRRFWKARLAVAGLRARRTLVRDLGLHPGDRLEQEVGRVIAGWGIETTRQLEARMNETPVPLLLRGGGVPPASQTASRLALIAAELTTETKVELPAMAPLFWRDPGSVPPSRYARASVSIPFLYRPFVVEDLPDGPAAEALWKRLASLSSRGGEGPMVPRRSVLVDAGIVSNFPIDVFHVHGEVPLAPTFGVKLGADHRVRHEVESLRGLAEALWDSASHARDYDFLERNPDFRHLVEYIHVETDRWLEFGITEDFKVEIFRRGASAAVRFLLNFDWRTYQSFRAAVAAGLLPAALRQTPAA